MAATREDIQAWFERGVVRKEVYMVVLCDTFDWEDYPSYFNLEEDARRKMRHPGPMQKLMEVYDLRADMGEQLNERRAMALSNEGNE